MVHNKGKVNYTLRGSYRAKKVILKVGSNGLEVVVPKRFGKRRLPGILEGNREWIEKELQRVKESPPLVAPECINLNAIDKRWRVDYQSQPTADGRFSVKEDASNRLLVEGDVDDARGVSSVLTHWLHLKPHAHLVPWLKEVSREVERGWTRYTGLRTFSASRACESTPLDPAGAPGHGVGGGRKESVGPKHTHVLTLDR